MPLSIDSRNPNSWSVHIRVKTRGWLYTPRPSSAPPPTYCLTFPELKSPPLTLQNEQWKVIKSGYKYSLSFI